VRSVDAYFFQGRSSGFGLTRRVDSPALHIVGLSRIRQRPELAVMRR
jgi:hypothetical protein